MLLAMYECFVENEKRPLHPSEVSRHSGVYMLDAARRMQETPEMFLKLPGRGDGLTRYALTPSMASRSTEEVHEFVRKQALRESVLYYTYLLLIASVLLILAILAWPIFKAL